MEDNNRLLERCEVMPEKTWAIEDIFADDECWEKEFLAVQKDISGFEQYRDRLGESAEILYGCLRLNEELGVRMNKLYSYAHQKLDQDTTVTKYQEMAGRSMNLWSAAASASAYIPSEILSVSREKLEEFRTSKDAVHEFDRYLFLIERDREHTRSGEVEELLADVYESSQSSSEIFKMFNNADTRFPKIEDENGELTEMSHGRYVSFLESKSRKVRKAAFDAMYDTFGKHKNTLAAAFSGNIRQAMFYAKARNFSSTRAYYLSDANVPEEVYDTLIDTVHGYMPLMYRYVALRKKMLGLSELHMYDLYTPVVPDTEIKVEFGQAKQMINEALRPMGEEYLNVLNQGFDKRWIDYCENQGKRSGAYCGGPYGVHPFVLMTYKDRLDDVFTLAHEMGHAMHSWFSDTNQTYTNSQYKIFVAEVASTCNEALLNRYLMEHTENKMEKAYIINHFLDGFKGTLFRQTMFAEFEKITHAAMENGQMLTAEALCRIYHDLNALYYGPDVVIDEGIDMEWARIPHFYSPFYVYQYATGFSAAIALSSRIAAGEEGAVEDYMSFLKGGCTKDPIDLLMDAGVDMRTKVPVEAAMKVFERILNELEELMD